MNIYVYTEFVDECVGNRFNGKKTKDADYILLDKVDDAEHILGSSRSVWQVSQALKKANLILAGAGKLLLLLRFKM